MASRRKKKTTSKRGSMRKGMKKKRETRQNSGGYLNLPEGIEVHEIKKKIEKFNILAYIVEDENHEYMDVGEPWYEKTYYVHYGIGPNEATVVCPAKTANENCPICDKLRAFQRDPDADENEIKALVPKERQMFLINPAGTDDVEVLLMSYHNFGRQLEEELDDGEEEYGDFAELEGGMTVKVRWGDEQIGKTKFKRANRIDFIEREEELSEEVIEKIFCLDNAVSIKSEEEILKIMAEGADEDELESDIAAPRKKKSRKKEEDEDDEDEEDFNMDEDEEEDEDDEEDAFEEDEDEEDEEEEPEPPKKKKAPAKKKAASKKKSKPDPEPEEDEDEEEDEEDEPDSDDEDWDDEDW